MTWPSQGHFKVTFNATATHEQTAWINIAIHNLIIYRTVQILAQGKCTCNCPQPEAYSHYLSWKRNWMFNTNQKIQTDNIPSKLECWRCKLRTYFSSCLHISCRDQGSGRAPESKLPKGFMLYLWRLESEKSIIFLASSGDKLLEMGSILWLNICAVLMWMLEVGEGW